MSVAVAGQTSESNGSGLHWTEESQIRKGQVQRERERDSDNDGEGEIGSYSGM